MLFSTYLEYAYNNSSSVINVNCFQTSMSVSFILASARMDAVSTPTDRSAASVLPASLLTSQAPSAKVVYITCSFWFPLFTAFSRYFRPLAWLRQRIRTVGWIRGQSSCTVLLMVMAVKFWTFQLLSVQVQTIARKDLSLKWPVICSLTRKGFVNAGVTVEQWACVCVSWLLDVDCVEFTETVHHDLRSKFRDEESGCQKDRGRPMVTDVRRVALLAYFQGTITTFRKADAVMQCPMFPLYV